MVCVRPMCCYVLLAGESDQYRNILGGGGDRSLRLYFTRRVIITSRRTSNSLRPEGKSHPEHKRKGRFLKAKLLDATDDPNTNRVSASEIPFYTPYEIKEHACSAVTYESFIANGHSYYCYDQMNEHLPTNQERSAGIHDGFTRLYVVIFPQCKSFVFARCTYTLYTSVRNRDSRRTFR